MPKYVHMIRQKSNPEMFSNGGMYPSFSKKGKMWTSAGALNGHISQVPEKTLRKTYKDAEIVTFELKETAVLDMTEAFARMERKQMLAKMHVGGGFMELLDKLYQAELVSKYKWIVHITYKQYKIDELLKEAKEVLKTFKISKTNYRTSERTWAFANKDDAAKFRLAMSGHNTHSYNGETLLEIDVNDNTTSESN